MNRHDSSNSINWRSVINVIVATAVVTTMTTAEAGSNNSQHLPNSDSHATLADNHLFIQSETPIPIVRSELQQGVTLNFGTDGTLVSYQSENGEPTFVDPNIYEQMKTTAISNKETQIIAILPNQITQSIEPEYTPSPEKPITTELPKDVISTEELTQRGITIVSPSNSVQLFIRKAAFEPGNLLDSYQTNGKNKITIVLIDSGYLNVDAMQGSQYDDYRTRLTNIPSPTADFQKKQIIELQNQIDDERLLLKHANETDNIQAINNLDTQILRLKLQKFQMERLTPIQAVNLELCRPGTNFVGLYLYGTLKSITQGPIIFLAVGKSDIGSILPIVTTIQVDSDGATKVVRHDYRPGCVDYTPNQNQTHPSPADFKFNPNDLYPYGAQTPAQTLGHEVEHDFKITRHPKFLGNNSNETATSMEAMKTIEQAHDLWIKEGDDSLYYFVIRLKDGSFILTQQNEQIAI